MDGFGFKSIVLCVCFFLIQMIFIYIALNHNNSCLKALYIMR